MRNLLRISLLLAALVAVATAPAAPGLMVLGDLPGGGFGISSWGNAISADGSTVAGWGTGVQGQEATRWRSTTGMTGLGDFSGGAYRGQAFGTSGNGSVVVGSSVGTAGEQAFVWTSSGGMVGLGDLPGGDFYSQARGVSADGSIVVGIGSAVTTNGEMYSNAFRWTAAGGMQSLGQFPGGYFSEGHAISANGNVIVGLGMNSALKLEAFRWTATEGMVAMGSVPGYEGFTSAARGVSADGSVIVGNSGIEAFRWTAETGMVGLGFINPLNSSRYAAAAAVSQDGSIVVGQTNDTHPLAFIWDEVNGMQNLNEVLSVSGVNMDGWDLASANSITVVGDTALITGQAVDLNGNRGTQAYIASVTVPVPPVKPVPEPASLAVLGLGGLALLRRRKA